jgi:hypothetical protein
MMKTRAIKRSSDVKLDINDVKLALDSYSSIRSIYKEEFFIENLFLKIILEYPNLLLTFEISMLPFDLLHLDYVSIQLYYISIYE